MVATYNFGSVYTCISVTNSSTQFDDAKITKHKNYLVNNVRKPTAVCET